MLLVPFRIPLYVLKNLRTQNVKKTSFMTCYQINPCILHKSFHISSLSQHDFKIKVFGTKIQCTFYLEYEISNTGSVTRGRWYLHLHCNQ